MTHSSHSAILASNGRIVVPLDVRKAVGLEKGGKVLTRVEDGRIILEPIAAAVARVQALARTIGDPSRDLVGELLSERREEAARD